MRKKKKLFFFYHFLNSRTKFYTNYTSMLSLVQIEQISHCKELVDESVRIFGFAVSAIFQIGFFSFRTEKLRFSGFSDCCGFEYISLSVFGKNSITFRVCYLMRFGVLSASRWKYARASPGCTSFQVLLATFGFDPSLFRFCGFLLLLLVRFCVSLFTPMPRPCSSSTLLQHVSLSNCKVR